MPFYVLSECRFMNVAKLDIVFILCHTELYNYTILLFMQRQPIFAQSLFFHFHILFYIIIKYFLLIGIAQTDHFL